MKITTAKLKSLFRKETFRKYLHKIISLDISTKIIAQSLTLGIFIGTLIPIGLQTIVIIPLNLLFRCKLILSYPATMISNPLTALPLYYITFVIGEKATGIEITWESFRKIIDSPSIESIINLGSHGLLVYFVGGLTQAIIYSILTYVLTYKIVVMYRNKHNRNPETGVLNSPSL
ncbi:MAG: DUF2062 domain-containing protein [Melioribacteraceae bacterium]|nr:DUF2062 domain-containing protein [Melioribacteraceae bacterium]MCF8412160.1 DUF2062 domain-containing protein [Melioribacteraceae bacterium]MCF8431840.1 DUF2062 domain-containing protein [Melioribacteraceae bacterium]